MIRCVAIAAATPELAQRRRAGEGAASGWGVPDAAPTRAWPARQGQVQSYTRRRSIRCQSHGGPRAPSPIRRPRRKPGAADGHLGSAEETLADYLVDRCELSGDVGCRPERPSGYRKINHLPLAPALAKIGSGMGSWFRFHPRRSRTTQGGAFGAEPKVRIHLPPAESLSLAPSRSRTWRTPAFSAGVRGWLGGFGLEIDWATRPSDPYENHVMDSEANDPNFDFQCKKGSSPIATAPPLRRAVGTQRAV